MTDEERSKLKEDVDFIKKLSEQLADSKKEAQHIRGSLNRIIKAGVDYDWYTKKYDELLNTYIANEFALKELASIFNMELKTISKPGSGEPVQYTLVATVGEKSLEIPLTEEQYIKLEKLCFLKKSENFTKGNNVSK